MALSDRVFLRFYSPLLVAVILINLAFFLTIAGMNTQLCNACMTGMLLLFYPCCVTGISENSFRIAYVLLLGSVILVLWKTRSQRNWLVPIAIYLAATYPGYIAYLVNQNITRLCSSNDASCIDYVTTRFDWHINLAYFCVGLAIFYGSLYLLRLFYPVVASLFPSRTYEIEP